MINVLFVCLGNICRSPTAHGIFRDAVKAAGLAERIYVDSAGTGDWHVGRGPDRRALASARSRGYDLADLVARQVSATDFDTFHYILAMDEQNLSDLRRLKPAGYRGHLGLLLDFARRPGPREVPDPYYGGDQGFEDVLAMVEDASEGLLDHLRQQL